jgi:hypothetical protein
MNRFGIVLLISLALGCRGTEPSPDVQQIVDAAIDAAGGDRYRTSQISFRFRDREYTAFRRSGSRVLVRVTQTDSSRIEDVLTGTSFERSVDGQPQALPDSTRHALAESVNSVHYFAYLPYGLNDAAVNKAYLGKRKLGDAEYHKVQVTFDQEGGGTDFEDVFVYWFNTETHLPDFLAYEYHTNGGGKRFRKAYNPRRIGGIRFVDYENFKYTGPLPVSELDSLYLIDQLEMLSRIELKEVQVTPGNYN